MEKNDDDSMPRPEAGLRAIIPGFVFVFTFVVAVVAVVAGPRHLTAEAPESARDIVSPLAPGVDRHPPP